MAELIIDRPYPVVQRRPEPEEDIIARTFRETRERAAAEAEKQTAKADVRPARAHWDAD